ncbi:restriction endonuclease subunit S [Paracoccus marinaquae]|uniref:Restriction endonuclease subunit S n=1 Tax=Paracoccus marinaquae TaxID=2841926 RepID=A0ABS6ANA0_9RHOB|nr:restriction endonuclease subunit S [Paracoccus marinaquae]MBU3032070.1 restriction endonuclease subunit S [Paracoccus marinaquae]
MTTVPEKVQQAYGLIPAGWRLEKLKFYAGVRNSNVDKTISDDEEPVLLCNYTDVYYNDRITRDLDFMQGSATESEIEKFKLKRDQVIITKDSEGWDDIGIPALVTEDMPDVLCGYHLSVFEPGPDLDGAFLAWLCRSDPLNDQFKLGANGVTRYGLGQYPMKNALVALPPIETQRLIARFLDAKTAQLDGLIEKKRALLDRLDEKRQALITRAVTKGLDPDAPMKPSGIDWLGDVPAHWDVLPLKRVLASSTYGISASLEPTGEVAILRMGNLVDGEIDLGDARFLDEVDEGLLLTPNDIVFNRTNSLDLVGKAAIFRGCQDYPVSLASYLVRFRFGSRYHPEYANYVMGTNDLMALGRTLALPSIGQANLNPSRYAQIEFPIPPFEEQSKIVEFLAEKVRALRKGATKIVTSIEKLEEYRAALITAAVTGKLTGLQ